MELDFAFAAIRKSIGSLLGHRLSLLTFTVCILLALIAYLLHEVGHYMIARRGGLQPRFRLFMFYRSTQFRRVHGWFSFLNIMSVEVPKLEYCSPRQVRAVAAAGTLFEFGFMLLISLCLLVGLALISNIYPVGWDAELVDGVILWIGLQSIISVVFNVFPIKAAINDGYAVFQTNKWITEERSHSRRP